ncbi:MAG TPA: GNAT family N-acetyltransferase [Candidatus Limnocylindrales bacterium]
MTANPASTMIRDATDDDLAAIRAILAAHGNDGAIVMGDVVGPYLRHLLARGRARVAVDGDTVVGFGAAIDTGRCHHLADLFIHPDRLGQGIGRPLLDAVFGDAERRTTFASDDPRALPIYVRAGMRPMWVSLYVEGPADRVPASPSTIRTAPATAEELAAVERSWTGVDRAADYAFWATQPEVDVFSVRDGDDVAAIGTARVRQASAVRVLDRLMVNPDPAVDPLPATLAAVARAGRGGVVLVTVQGPNPLLRVLLDLGFRIADRDQFMASDPDLMDPARLIPSAGML